ncbi:MAG: hypothetical protein ACR2KZ_09935, partial [Segetibacter sp.]
FAYLIIPSLAVIFQAVHLLKKVLEIMADNFMYLPDNDSTALDGGRLWCFFRSVRTLKKSHTILKYWL